MFQQFTVSVRGGLNATPFPVPVMVRELSGVYYGTLGIKIETDVVFINGDDGKEWIGGQRVHRWCN